MIIWGDEKIFKYALDPGEIQRSKHDLFLQNNRVVLTNWQVPDTEIPTYINWHIEIQENSTLFFKKNFGFNYKRSQTPSPLAALRTAFFAKN